MELKDIQSLIKFVTKSGASEVKLEMEEKKLPLEQANTIKVKLPLYSKCLRWHLLLQHLLLQLLL